MKIILMPLFLFFAFVGFGQSTYQFTNGNVWNGSTFLKRNFWTVKDRIVFKQPDKTDSVIDLTGKFVIPPFAEGHNHNLEGTYELEKRISNYINNGVFYVKILSSIKKRFEPNLIRLNNNEGPDVSYTFAPLTGPGGHPIRIRELAFDRGDYTGVFASKSELEGHGYFMVSDEMELTKKWPFILAENSMFLKIVIANSEEYEKRKDDQSFFGFKGIDPNLIGKIVKMAHQSNLRVSAHIETAHDFHQAVINDVDEIAHLPCLNNLCLLDEADVKLASRKKIMVTTTISLIGVRKDQSMRDTLMKYAVANLSLLKKHNVKICIGSDNYYDNSIGEIGLLKKSGVFSNEELLNMWFETASSCIFPKRKIGKLLTGYEPSFIILNNNPIENLESVKDIYLMVKSGRIIKSRR